MTLLAKLVIFYPTFFSQENIYLSGKYLPLRKIFS
jgi:hypothetical protein